MFSVFLYFLWPSQAPFKGQYFPLHSIPVHCIPNNAVLRAHLIIFSIVIMSKNIARFWCFFCTICYQPTFMHFFLMYAGMHACNINVPTCEFIGAIVFYPLATTGQQVITANKEITNQLRRHPVVEFLVRVEWSSAHLFSFTPRKRKKIIHVESLYFFFLYSFFFSRKGTLL